ncbi:MAG: hypothetical protein A2521_03540 [Deltaproteobacteria bacterium RIFOXYD12_FULL_57_12]|nr:MAG: hypothetical protein A2521_03540 [Deltaproteobacteria bacterium RIFOXYD12_FULL_57_12]
MIIGQYQPVVGGAERQAAKLAKKLLHHNVKVDVLTIHRRGQKITENIDGVHVIRVAKPSFGILKIYLAMLATFFYILKNKARYSCIHIHSASYLAFAAVIAAKLARLPVIIKTVSSAPRFDLVKLESEFFLGRLYARQIVAHAARFIAISPQIATDMRHYGITEQRIITIPNGVEPTCLETPQKKDPTVLGLIVIARLTELKNISFILDVVSNLTCPYTLAIYGEGPQRIELESMISEKALKNVRLMGNVPEQAVYEALAASDIFLLSSTVEGLSNALLEAMSIGVVPIVTNIAPNCYALGDRLSATCCLPLEKSIWLQKLLYYYQNPEARKLTGSLVREKSKEFSLDGVAKRYIALYETLVREVAGHA